MDTSLSRRHSHKFSPARTLRTSGKKQFWVRQIPRVTSISVPLVGSTQQQGTILTLRDLPSNCSPVSINNTSHLLVVPSLVMTHQFICLLPEEKHFNGTADYSLREVPRAFPKPFILLSHPAVTDGHPHSPNTVSADIE